MKKYQIIVKNIKTGTEKVALEVSGRWLDIGENKGFNVKYDDVIRVIKNAFDRIMEIELK